MRSLVIFSACVVLSAARVPNDFLAETDTTAFSRKGVWGNDGTGPVEVNKGKAANGSADVPSFNGAASELISSLRNDFNGDGKTADQEEFLTDKRADSFGRSIGEEMSNMNLVVAKLPTLYLAEVHADSDSSLPDAPAEQVGDAGIPNRVQFSGNAVQGKDNDIKAKNGDSHFPHIK